MEPGSSTGRAADEDDVRAEARRATDTMGNAQVDAMVFFGDLLRCPSCHEQGIVIVGRFQPT